MINLLNYEKKRIKHSKCFWFILSASIVFSLFSVLMTKLSSLINGNYIEFNDETGITQIFMGIKGIDALISGMSDMLITLVVILISTLTTSEFVKNVTVKNVVIRGYTRLQIYISKLITSFVITLILILISVLCYAIPSTFFWGFSNGDVAWGNIFLLFFSKILAFFALTTVVFFISMLLRNFTGSIAVSIGLLRFVPFITNYITQLNQNNYIDFYKFEITSAISSIVDSNTSLNICNSVIICSIIYISIFTVLGLVIFNKRDIK